MMCGYCGECAKDCTRFRRCAECHGPIGKDDGPEDGWQMEDGRTLCHSCCVADTQQVVNSLIRGGNSSD